MIKDNVFFVTNRPNQSLCSNEQHLPLCSAVHVTFLWPVIITEMVQVFSYIEQQLVADTVEFRYQQSSEDDRPQEGHVHS